MGRLPLIVLLILPARVAFAAPSDVSGKTIKDLSDAIPLGVLERSVGPKFYQSLLRSPLADWTIVRARLAHARLSGARVIRGSKNPAYNSLALKFASELRLVAHDASGTASRADSALMHLLIYQIADGVMAISFAYPEAAPGSKRRTSAPSAFQLKRERALGRRSGRPKREGAGCGGLTECRWTLSPFLGHKSFSISSSWLAASQGFEP